MNELIKYDDDLTAWVETQLHFLKSKQFDKLDLENLIEEFETVGKSERRSMESYFVILLAHLLKAHYQPEMQSRSWFSSVGNSRREINKILKDSPSLKREMQMIFEKAWPDALMLAMEDTGMKKNQFPATCPWTLNAVMQNLIG